MKKIQKGSRWLCIKTVVMNKSNDVAYIQGKTYKSEMDDCITNEQGTINHHWPLDSIGRYFREVKNG